MNLSNEEKALKIIRLYSQGLDAEEIALKVGYSNSRSLSRFMRKMNYKWDNRQSNYVKEDSGIENKKQVYKAAEENNIKGNTKNIDPLDLLEDPKVLLALEQSDLLLDLINSQKVKESKTSTASEKPSYSFWKKAQEFAFMRKASFTTSVRLPIELHDRLNRFKEDSNLTQTQILCMAIDYFMDRFESKIIK
jgi:hypothetical protein